MACSIVAVIVQIQILRLASAAIPSKHQPPSFVDSDRVQAVELLETLMPDWRSRKQRLERLLS
jgi:hypothetical protein